MSLIFLSIVTTIEVALGILKPQILMVSFLRMKLLNWIFIIMTIIKAYYIAWDFMHIRDEKTGLKNSIVLPLNNFDSLFSFYSPFRGRLYF